MYHGNVKTKPYLEPCGDLWYLGDFCPGDDHPECMESGDFVEPTTGPAGEYSGDFGDRGGGPGSVWGGVRGSIVMILSSEPVASDKIN